MKASRAGAFALLGAASALLILIGTTPVGAADTTTADTMTQSNQLPSLIDSPLPSNLVPTLSGAKTDRPKPYQDRCHTQQNLEKSLSTCEYGNLKSKTSIVLFGDSHALSWFPAIERLAIAKKWKLISLTMSSCWPADIPAWNSTTNQLMPNCPIWRNETLDDIAQIKPYLTFVAGTRGFTTVDQNNTVLLGIDRTTAWEAGMVRTLDKLKSASKLLVYLGDTPVSLVDVPSCLAAHRLHIAECATPYAKSVSTSWITEEQKVAMMEKAIWVDPTSWICTTDPCSPLVGRYQIFVDKGHLTATFAATLERPLWAQVTASN